VVAIQNCGSSSLETLWPDQFNLIYLEKLFYNYNQLLLPLRQINDSFPADGRSFFASAKQRYGITELYFPVSDYTLFHLLAVSENNYIFNDLDIEWLNDNCLFSISANSHIRRYNASADSWFLIKACSLWRKARYPQTALQVAENVSTTNKRLKAALQTTRGGAFKDLKDLNTAEQCAREALTYEETKYPYALLGAIYYLRGLPHLGDEFFEKARKLGDSRSAQDRSIKEAYREAGNVEQDAILKQEFPR
jgi:hypothetical protein